jgi:hypothetical protein
MAYGSLALDEISTSGDLAIAGNVTSTGTITSSTGTVYPLVLGTRITSTSGTLIEFNVPSWAGRITIGLSGVSTSGTSDVIIQLGTASGFVVSGYLGAAITLVGGASPGSAAYTSGFLIRLGGAASASATRHGRVVITTNGNNIWIGDVMVSLSDAIYTALGSGSLNLTSALTRVRVTTVNGTDTFDAGSINILYE